jgi:hypothetical protein
VTLTRSFWRGVFLVLAAAWGWLMLVVGLLLISEWSSWAGSLTWAGVALIAIGQFVCAIVADWLFPRASRRLSASVELGAWGLAAVSLSVAFAVWLRA